MVVLCCLFYSVYFTLKLIQEKSIKIISSTFSVPLFFLAGISLVSTFFQTPNLAISLITPLSTTTYVSAFLLFVFLIQFIDQDQKEMYFNLTIFSSLLISAYVILMYIGIIPAEIFTPAGRIFATTIFLCSIAVYTVTKSAILISQKKDSSSTSIFLYGF